MKLITAVFLSLFILTAPYCTGEDAFIITETGDNNSTINITSVEEVNNTPYFVLFTSTFCDPCLRMKSTEVPKLQKAGYGVTIVDISKDDRWNRKYNISTVPRLFLLDRATRKTLKGPWIGFTRSEVILKSIAPTNKMSIKDWINENYKRSTPLSWGVSGQSVFDHLCDGSNGTHNFTRDEISSLEEWEALALHDAIHIGKFIP